MKIIFNFYRETIKKLESCIRNLFYFVDTAAAILNRLTKKFSFETFQFEYSWLNIGHWTVPFQSLPYKENC